jgi:5'-nucleotidase
MVMERQGIRIGFIGLMTPSLPFIVSDGEKLHVNRDYTSLARTLVQKLKREENVDIIIALTHLGVGYDESLARKICGIDIICGGHSHTVMKKGKEIVVKHPDGQSTIITQAGHHGRYLGVLKLNLKNGAIVNHEWDPVLIDSSIGFDPEMDALVHSYKQKLPETKLVTHTLKPIDCRSFIQRTRETAVGDLICDAVRSYFNVDIAIQNGGGIRGGRVIQTGPVQTDQIDTMLPFGNTVVIINLSGKMIKTMLEHSVAKLPLTSGGFLQVSGIRCKVDTRNTAQKPKYDKHGKPVGILVPGKRVVNIEVLGVDDGYHPLDPDKIYSVAANSYLAGGGNGYWMLKYADSKTNTKFLLEQTVKQVLQSKKEISPTVDGRIKIIY